MGIYKECSIFKSSAAQGIAAGEYLDLHPKCEAHTQYGHFYFVPVKIFWLDRVPRKLYSNWEAAAPPRPPRISGERAAALPPRPPRPRELWGASPLKLPV